MIISLFQILHILQVIYRLRIFFDLYNDGFIFYDFNSERIQVLPKLYNYVQAASDLGDHDVISFSSTIRTDQYNTGDKNLVNAALNIKSKK